MTGLGKVIAIGAANYTGYAVTTDGSVWAWGSGGQGELGNNTVANSPTPVQVSGLTDITAVTGGADTGYACAPMHGLGVGLQQPRAARQRWHRRQPRAGAGERTVRGDRHRRRQFLRVRPAGRRHRSGLGLQPVGQLGDNTTTDRSTPVPVSGLTGVVAIGSGSVAFSGYAIEAG